MEVALLLFAFAGWPMLAFAHYRFPKGRRVLQALFLTIVPGVGADVASALADTLLFAWGHGGVSVHERVTMGDGVRVASLATLADLLGAAPALGYTPRGVHRPEPAWQIGSPAETRRSAQKAQFPTGQNGGGA
jgi:hypothetical protein